MAPSKENEADRRVTAWRAFNRFYTRQIGLLQRRLLRSPFSLAEARLLYELAQRQTATATGLGQELELDPGYLSRMLRGFRRQGLVRSHASPNDGRQQLLSLTPRGRRAFASLDSRSRADIGAMLRKLTEAEQFRLLQAMSRIEQLLGGPAASPKMTVPFVLRSPVPGDMGWVVHRHGALYAQEYGYDEGFEALVASIVAKFVQGFDPRRERCWIAERDGEIVGSVFLVAKSKTVAKLRLLLLEPEARGMGLGGRLVRECVAFARRAGYRKVTLWTQSDLHPARRLYQKAGFRLVAEKAHRSFGKDLVAETWDLDLSKPEIAAPRS
jgi:DNA-binding MarR family transcriptional regulator/GNAT superfamily N-acetyltransferase